MVLVSTRGRYQVVLVSTRGRYQVVLVSTRGRYKVVLVSTRGRYQVVLVKQVQSKKAYDKCTIDIINTFNICTSYFLMRW